MSMTILDKYTIDIIKIITPLVYIALGIAIYEIAKTMLMRKSAASLLKKNHHKKRVETVNLLIQNIIICKKVLVDFDQHFFNLLVILYTKKLLLHRYFIYFATAPFRS